MDAVAKIDTEAHNDDGADDAPATMTPGELDAMELQRIARIVALPAISPEEAQAALDRAPGGMQDLKVRARAAYDVALRGPPWGPGGLSRDPAWASPIWTLRRDLRDFDAGLAARPDRVTMAAIFVAFEHRWRAIATLPGPDRALLESPAQTAVREAEHQQYLTAHQIANAGAVRFSASAFLAQLGARGISVTMDAQGGLVIRPAGAIDETARSLLRQHRAAIVAALQDFEVV